MKKLMIFFSLFIFVLISLISLDVLNPGKAKASNDWSVFTANFTGAAEIDTAEDKDGTFTIKAFEWHPNAAGDDLVITDSAGYYLWTTRATAGAPNHESYGIEYNDLGWEDVRGINIVTIDGGTLYIHGHD